MVTNIKSVFASDVAPGGTRTGLLTIGCALLGPMLLVIFVSSGSGSASLLIAGLIAWVIFLIVSMILARRSRKLLPRGVKGHVLARVATVVSYVSLAWLLVLIVGPLIYVGGD